MTSPSRSGADQPEVRLHDLGDGPVRFRRRVEIGGGLDQVPARAGLELRGSLSRSAIVNGIL